MKPTVEKITPAKAKAMLAGTKFKNRNVTGSVVEKYASDITNGWVANGASIVISTEGDVLDGQHRLHAVIKTGKPIESVVVRDVIPDAFKTIDSGKPRSLGHVFEASGERHANTLAAVVRILWRLERYPNSVPVGGSGGQQRTPPSNTQCDQFLELNPGVRTVVAEIESRKNVLRGLCVRSHLAALCYVVIRDRDDICVPGLEGEALAFVDDLTGRPPASETVRVFLERMFKSKTSRFRLSNGEKWKLLVRTWNYYLAGRAVRKLAVPDACPEINLS